jgi:hypothetical protein
VVLFGAGSISQTISGPVSFVEPAAATKVVVADLQPNTAYSVTVQVTGGNHTVTIQPQAGATFATSEMGTLYINIAASGTVSAGT